MSDRRERHPKASLSLHPTRAHFPVSEKTWGVFAPVYALHSKRSFGAGDLTDLESLMDWMHRTRRTRSYRRCRCSRLSWRTLRAQPLLPNQPAVLERVLHRSCQGARSFLRHRKRRRLMEAAPRLDRHLSTTAERCGEKRRVLEALAQHCSSSKPSNERRKDFEQFLADNPEARSTRASGHVRIRDEGLAQLAQTASSDDRTPSSTTSMRNG